MTPDDVCARAQHLIACGDFDTAQAELEQALTQHPEDARLWLMKGVETGLAGKHSEALDCFNRCTELHPRVFSGWYHKGVAYSAMGQITEAIACYRRARRLDPTDASSAFNLGAELCKTGAFAEAVEQLWDAKTLGHERAAEAHSVCRQILDESNEGSVE